MDNLRLAESKECQSVYLYYFDRSCYFFLNIIFSRFYDAAKQNFWKKKNICFTLRYESKVYMTGVVSNPIVLISAPIIFVS